MYPPGNSTSAEFAVDPRHRPDQHANASHLDGSDEDRELAFANIKKAANYYGVDMTETDWTQLGRIPHTGRTAEDRRKSARKAAATRKRRERGRIVNGARCERTLSSPSKSMPSKSPSSCSSPGAWRAQSDSRVRPPIVPIGEFRTRRASALSPLMPPRMRCKNSSCASIDKATSARSSCIAATSLARRR